MRFLALLALSAAAFVFIGEVLRAQNVLADWHAYYRAAKLLIVGRDFYAEGMTLLGRNSYDYWVETDGQYVYPPLLAIVVAPLAAILDIGKAGDVWLVALSAATAGVLFVVLLVLNRPMRIETIAVVAIPTLTSIPLLLSIRYGQVDVLLLLLTTLAVLAHARERRFLAGLALGLAAAVKPTLALYGLFFLRKRQWSTLATAAATAMALGLGPFLFLPQSFMTDWLAIARYFGTGDYAAYPSNQSVHGLLLRSFVGGPRHLPLFQNETLAMVGWVAVGIAALAVGWVCVSGRPSNGATTAVEFSLTGALLLLVSPLSEDIHYVLLLPALAILADRVVWADRPLPTWWIVLALAGCLYFMQPWLDFAYNRGDGRITRLIYSGVFVYGLVLVGTALAALLFVERRTRLSTSDTGTPSTLDSPSISRPASEPAP